MNLASNIHNWMKMKTTSETEQEREKKRNCIDLNELCAVLWKENSKHLILIKSRKISLCKRTHRRTSWFPFFHWTIKKKWNFIKWILFASNFLLFDYEKLMTLLSTLYTQVFICESAFTWMSDEKRNVKKWIENGSKIIFYKLIN